MLWAGVSPFFVSPVPVWISSVGLKYFCNLFLQCHWESLLLSGVSFLFVSLEPLWISGVGLISIHNLSSWRHRESHLLDWHLSPNLFLQCHREYLLLDWNLSLNCIFSATVNLSTLTVISAQSASTPTSLTVTQPPYCRHSSIVPLARDFLTIILVGRAGSPPT